MDVKVTLGETVMEADTDTSGVVETESVLELLVSSVADTVCDSVELTVGEAVSVVLTDKPLVALIEDVAVALEDDDADRASVIDHEAVTDGVTERVAVRVTLAPDGVATRDDVGDLVEDILFEVDTSVVGVCVRCVGDSMLEGETTGETVMDALPPEWVRVCVCV